MPESNKLSNGSNNESPSSSSSSSSIVLNSSKSSNISNNPTTNQSTSNGGGGGGGGNSANSTTTTTTAALQQVTEKPTHYTYLKGFRVEQCPLFLQHKCTQHRPYTCFYWHFKNQRRRRPIRRRDGTFNYNPDVYCEKYDEQSGVCPNSDECPFVHRNAGDTEKRYHLRYYKTAICIHETDNKGNCTKNGAHCAFAHGPNDTRPPVYDLKELQQQSHNHQHESGAVDLLHQSQQPQHHHHAVNGGSSNGSSMNGGNGVNADFLAQINEKTLNLSSNLEKERQLNEDPKWNDTNYVLINYKTEPCKRPPRLCRQGFACPQYHNARDKRRNPSMFKYRSTPCPNVKQGDDWLEPTVCENGDQCKYCHSRTEQQFHPEIYKSSKCNDMISTGYCPRGPFCAFAHIDQELKNQRAHSTSESSSSEYTLENFISTVLPLSSGSKDNENSEAGELASSGSGHALASSSSVDFDLNESILKLTLQQQRAVAAAMACLNNKQLSDEQASALVQSALSGGSNSGGNLQTDELQNYFMDNALTDLQRQQQQQQQMSLSSQLSFLNSSASQSSNSSATNLLMAGLNSAALAGTTATTVPQLPAAAASMYNKPIGSDRPLDRTKLLQQSTSININNPTISSNKPSPSPLTGAGSGLLAGTGGAGRSNSPYQLINTDTTTTTTITTTTNTLEHAEQQQSLMNKLSRSGAAQSSNGGGGGSAASKTLANNLAVVGKLNLLQQQQQQHQSLLASAATSSQIHLNSNSSTTASSSSSPSPIAVAAAAVAQQQQQSSSSSSLLTSGRSVTDETSSIEKLREDLSKQTEVSSKLETLCLQYQNWIEKLTYEANEWKAKYIKSEAEKKSLEIQLLNKNV